MHRRLQTFGPCSVIVLLLVGAPLSAAQQAGASGAPERPAGSEGTLLERLRRLGEEIQELRQQFREGLAQAAPTAAATALEADYHLSDLKITGEVDGKTARLTAELKATVHRAGRFGIPLNPFGTLQSVEPSGAVIASNEGFQWLVEGKGAHELRLQFSVSLDERQVGSRQLRMPVVSPLESPVARLLLTVPGERIEARNSDGQQLPVAWDGARSVIEWNGLPHEGVLTVEWQRRPAREPEPARLQSEARWQIDVQKNVALSEASLVLQSRGGAFDQFQVLLPPGVREATCEVAGKKSENPGPPQRPESGSLLSVMLEAPTTGPLSVRLGFEQPIDPEKGELVLRGLEVPGAVSQSGYLLVQEAEELEVMPAESDSLQRISLRDLPQGLREGRGGLAFRYLRQPFELVATVRPRRPIVAVEPNLSLLLVRDGDAVQGLLHARWRVHVQHAPIEEIDVDLAGWQASLGAVRGMRVEPLGNGAEQLIDPEGSSVDDAGGLHVRLSRPMQEPLVLEVEAQRALGTGRGVAVALPVVLGRQVSDSRVALYSGDAVRVRPRYEAMPAAVPDYFGNNSEPAAPQRPDLEGPAQVLRVRDARQALSLDLEVLPAIVQAGCRSRITLRRESALVEQRFTLLTQNAPLSELLLGVPLSLFNTRVYAAAGAEEQGEGRFEQLLISRLRRIAVETAAGTNESVWRVGVDLIEPQRGGFEWMLRYEIPLEVVGKGATPVSIPLVMPASDVLTHNDVEVFSEAAWQVKAGNNGAWQAMGSGSANGPLQFRADRRVFSIGLQVSRRAQFAREPATIARAWLRTGVEPGGVQRYQGVYQVRTEQQVLAVKFPPRALRPRVRVDGTAARFEIGDDGNYRVFLSGDAGRGAAQQGEVPYLLEIEYAVTSSGRLSPLASSLRVAAPWFPNARWEDRWYWQVLVPKQQHLFDQSEQYYPEVRWQWGGLAWVRRPSRSTAELNRWLHAELPWAASADWSNEYLFSRLGGETTVAGAAGSGNPMLTLRLVTPPMLILMGSGAVVVFGLLFVSWPAARSLPVVFVAAFAVMVAASLFPMPALLLLHAAVPGLALVGVAVLLRWNLWRRQQRGVLVSAERSSILTIPSTMAPQPESAGSVGSTRTGSRSSVGGVP